MTKTRVIRVFSFILALTLVFAMISTPAYALTSQQFGAWVASALTAINITWNSTVAPYFQFVDYIVDPFQISDTGVFEKIPYTWDDLDDIYSRSTLSISGDITTIDGVDYRDIWLSHDAAEKFRVNAFDIKEAFEIASESEGTFVSGIGYADGMPVFHLGKNPQNLATQTYILGVGNNACGNTNVFVPNSYNSRYITYSNGTSYSTARFSPTQALDFYWYTPGDTLNNLICSQGGYMPNTLLVNTPFDFDWVSGIIPAQPLGENDGLHFLVPSNPEQFTSDPEAQQVINNINNYYNTDPVIKPGVDLNLSDPDIIDKLDDLFDIINGILKLTKPLFGPKDDVPSDPIEPDPQPEPYPDPEPEPYPDPDPDPSTPLTDINWKSLFDVLKNIFQKLSNIDVTSQTIANTLTEFRNRFEDWMKDIRDNIVNKFDELSNILQDILDAVHDIADSIVHGNADWFRDIVDSIWNPFLRIFGIFKSHIGIWHYVVDWLQQIGAPFRFFFGVLTNLGTLYTSPIYAMFAGILVIAIYRRFGR